MSCVPKELLRSLEDAFETPASDTVLQHPEEEALEDGRRARQDRRARGEDDAEEPVVQAEVEPGDGEEQTDRDDADDVVFEVTQEDAGASEEEELLDDQEEGDDGYDNDRHQAARLLSDILRR